MTPLERIGESTQRRPLLFLEIEGSSRDAASWPIGLSYAWFEDGRIASRRHVIAPRAGWPLHAWCEAAAEVHGLTLGRLRDGQPAEEVAAATERFHGFEVVSADARWHQAWLDRLRGPAAVRIPVRMLQVAACERLGPQAAEGLGRSLAARAGGAADAERLAEAWRAAERALERVPRVA